MNTTTIGIDEVGRGALIGNVVTSAVYFTNDTPKEVIALCTDSKKLSAKKREYIYAQLIEHTCYSIGEATPKEIDELNILGATMLAMQRAFHELQLTNKEYQVYVDGNKCPEVPNCEYVIGGDGVIPEIGAASIIAKVVRDRQMHTLDLEYPDYGLESHKGYPSKHHLEALHTYGALPEHRKSYAPVRRIIDP